MINCKELIEKAEDIWLSGETEASKKILDDVIANKKCSADHAEAYMFLGHVLEEQNKYADALASFKKALELNQDKENYFIQGYSYQGKGMVLKHSQDEKDIEEAISCFNQVLAVIPENTNALFNKSKSLLLQGKITDSLVSLQIATTMEPIYKEIARKDADFVKLNENPSFRIIIN